MPEDPLAEVFAVLHENKLFRAASDEGLRRLSAAAKVRTVSKGEVVTREGEPADRFALILEGSVPSYLLSPDGRRLLHVVGGRADTVGLPPTVAGGRYSFYFEATTPARIAWFSRADLMDLLEREPAVAMTMLTTFADWLVMTLRDNRNMSLDVPSRVAGYLFGRAVAEGKKVPEGVSVNLGLYKSDLASYLSTVPETLSRAFATLASEGLITVRGRTVIVHDVGGLARRGEGLWEGETGKATATAPTKPTVRASTKRKPNQATS
jgi:CRP/FNR family transcriptional regulator, dissimilatory nitrate respiration regulator